MRSRRIGGLIGTAACLVALMAAPVGAVAAPGAADPTPGAPGIGDPYYPDYGNGGYQISHYDLRLRYQPSNDHLRGTATLLGTATQDLSRFDLDFALTTDSVRVNNRPAGFTRSGDHELVVTPARPIVKGTPITIVAKYHGVPSTVTAEGFTSWMRTDDGAVAANEPEVSWWWYPSNDHPLDKASFDVNVEVPDGYQAISNGRLLGKNSRLGWTSWRWRESAPMATYLAVLAVGHYDVHSDTTVDGTPIITAYDKGLGDDMGAAQSSVERTGAIVKWESSLYGPYPFDAIGGIVPNYEAGFALEDQTRPMYGKDFFETGSDPYVVVHENAHQWYGDSVSVHHWSDIWLNEGFAGYTEWQWSEHVGDGTAAEVARYTYDQHPADDDLWKVKPGDPGAAHQFSDAVYDRGAMALQALRNVVGDDTFFAIMRTWAQSKQGGNGSIDQFIALAQRLSGKDLTKLFHVWLFTTGKPPASAFHWPATARAATPVAQPASYQQIQRTNRMLAGH